MSDQASVAQSKVEALLTAVNRTMEQEGLMGHGLQLSMFRVYVRVAICFLELFALLVDAVTDVADRIPSP